jgi:hypothetical protein
MREHTTAETIERLMSSLAREVREPANIYFTGGVTAVLHGWREATVDVDLKSVPDSDEVLRAIPALKERLNINIELASPDDFIPELPEWRDRSIFIRREGRLSYFHYDMYAQALSKIERGHAQDVTDVHQLLEGLVDPSRLLELFEAIEPQLYRFPAIDPASFRAAVERVVRGATKDQ